MGVRKAKFCLWCGRGLAIKTIESNQFMACQNEPCGFVDWNNPVPIVNVLVPYGPGVVLVRRAHEPGVGDWCLPCGHMDAMESPYQAACRELQEESGLVVEEGDLKLMNVCAREGENCMHIYFEAKRVLKGSLTPSAETPEVKVFRQQDLPDNFAFADHKEIVKAWFAERKSGDWRQIVSAQILPLSLRVNLAEDLGSVRVGGNIAAN